MKAKLLLAALALSTLPLMSQQMYIQQQTTTTTTTAPGYYYSQPGTQIQVWGNPGYTVTQYAQPTTTTVTYYTDPLTGQVYYTDPYQGQYILDEWGNYVAIQPQVFPQQAPVYTPIQTQPVYQDPYYVQHPHNVNPGHCGTPAPNYGVTDAGTFSLMIQQISQQNFDSSRLQVAKQMVSSNRLTSAQVTDMARLMSFESTRLDFLKFAYGYVVDPGSYFLVNNALTFSSSVDDLNRYLMGTR